MLIAEASETDILSLVGVSRNILFDNVFKIKPKYLIQIELKSGSAPLLSTLSPVIPLTPPLDFSPLPVLLPSPSPAFLSLPSLISKPSWKYHNGFSWAPFDYFTNDKIEYNFSRKVFNFTIKVSGLQYRLDLLSMKMSGLTGIPVFSIKRDV